MGEKLTLWGGVGGGSTAVEAALALAGLDYDFIAASPWDTQTRHAELAKLNPVGQIPALAFPDGSLMTESAAILLWIAEAAPDKRLAPPPGDSRRRDFLRWLMFFSAFYSTYSISDRLESWIGPDADDQARLKEGALARRKALWAIAEDALAPDPYLLGGEMTLLDVYVAQMRRWSPGKDWFDAHCPKLRGAAERVEAHPIVAEIWAKNFGDRL